MPKERRILRLQQLILEVVAETLQRDARSPHLEMVSVTRVKLSADLAHAVVSWSCLAAGRRRERAAEALANVLPLLQRRVAKELGTRVTPHLELRFDPTLESAQRLENIFQRLRDERGEDDEEAEEAEGMEALEEANEPEETPPVGS